MLPCLHMSPTVTSTMAHSQTSVKLILIYIQFMCVYMKVSSTIPLNIDTKSYVIGFKQIDGTSFSLKLKKAAYVDLTGIN